MKDYEIRQLFVAVMEADSEEEGQAVLDDFFGDQDVFDAFEGMRDVALFMKGIIQGLVRLTGEEESFAAFLRKMRLQVIDAEDEGSG